MFEPDNCRIPVSNRSSRPITNSRSGSGASRSTTSSSPIPLTTATAGRFPSSARGCTHSFKAGN